MFSGKENSSCLLCKEMKLKWNGGVSWWGVNGIIAGAQVMERARKVVAIMLNDVWHSVVVHFGCVTLESS